ncbi:MAG: hypothetical protein HC872_05135 [Gammaproteobacteria bacterium]|nr:hypothetical protein [Gammaproteobacteria bacterium]
MAIFGIGAVGGVMLAMHVLRGRLAPWFLSVGHAAAGATGIVLVLIAFLQSTGGSRVGWVLGIFVLAAIGGFYLASFHARQKFPPRAAVLAHGALAIIGFVTLLMVVLGA